MVSVGSVLLSVTFCGAEKHKQLVSKYFKKAFSTILRRKAP